MKRDDKLKDFLMYEGSNKFLGTVDVTLPEIAFMSESTSGAGIAGEVEIPVMGLVQAMGITINFKNIEDDQFSLVDGKAKNLEFRGSVQKYNTSSGELEEEAIKVITKCLPKKLGLGTLAKASAMGSNAEFECTYIKIFIDGKEVTEIDKFNYICKINGNDLLGETRKNLGM